MITTLYTVTLPIYQALKDHDYSMAEYKRRVAFVFLNDVFDWWPRWKIRRMYIFKAQYDHSIDIGKVERDFARIKQRWDPEKMFAKHERSYSTSHTYTDYQSSTKNDNDTYLYDISSFV